MSPVEAVSVIVAIVGVLSWMSRRALNSPILTVRVMTLVLTIAIATCGELVSGLRPWFADLSLPLQAHLIFQIAVIPLLIFLPSANFARNVQLRTQAFSIAKAAFPALVIAVLVGATVRFTSEESIPWTRCLMFGLIVCSIEPMSMLRLRARSSAGRNHRLFNESLIISALVAITVVAILTFLFSTNRAPGSGDLSWCRRQQEEYWRV